MKLNILSISQKDPKWGLKKLGTSSVTIGNYGCYLTCLSMLLKYYGHEQSPDVLNELFKSNGVYANKNLISSSLVPKAYPDIKFDEKYNCKTKPCDLTKIDKYLNEKKPVIAQVDFSPKAGIQTHFVLIIGKENEDYFINDPWTGETYFFSAKYGDPSRYIYGLRLYSGEVKEVTNDKDKISDLEIKVKNSNEALAEALLENGELRKAIKLQEIDNKDLAEQISEARGQRDQAVAEKGICEAEVKRLEGLVEKRDQHILDLLEKIKGLEDTVKELKKDALLTMAIKDLIIEIINKIFKFNKKNVSQEEKKTS